MRVLGIIPARAGSKRVPGKNLRILGGKPLVLRAIEAARGARTLSRVIVSSDDTEVLKLAGELGLLRPAEISTDTALAIDYVHHALRILEGGGDARYEAVAILQPSSPFTTPEDIDETVAALEDAPGADSAVSVVEVEHATHPLKLKRLVDGRLLSFLEEEGGRMASHELPKLFVRNGSVYATRRNAIDRGEIIGNDSRAWVMPRERSVDINDELDFQFAEFLAQQRG
jgi:CMP-N,N'-diacetyllegionaminic acid synthase